MLTSNSKAAIARTFTKARPLRGSIISFETDLSPGDKASMSHPGHVLGLNKRKEYDLPHRVKRRRSRVNEF